MKDLFSGHAAAYAKFRPTYPAELYNYLFSLLSRKKMAWDCATGNGQVAVELAAVFNKVIATDISKEQLEHANQLSNIRYRVQQAEESFLKKPVFDLITVGQAIHWFDFEKFYNQVYQVLHPNGILAIFGYSLLYSSGELNTVIQYFYNEIVGSYWEPERRYLDEDYLTIPFPFAEEITPKFEITCHWTQAQFLSYLNTWSAVKAYEKDQDESPIIFIKEDVEEVWGTKQKREFKFPLHTRIGRLL